MVAVISSCDELIIPRRRRAGAGPVTGAGLLAFQIELIKTQIRTETDTFL